MPTLWQTSRLQEHCRLTNTPGGEMNVQISVLVMLTVLLCLYLPAGVHCRAIMVEPPHRSSLWRFNYNTTVNTRDDDLNCGGYDWQWRVNRGRCGVCGDRYSGIQDNDDKGRYSSGIIVRSYRDGYYVNITFEVSANYLGYVEFRLCPRNTTELPLNQSCFDRYPLWIDEAHGTRYYIGSRGGIYDIHIRLPGGLVCRKCVLQWTYKTGYRYNGDDRCKCLGCGSQEQYINCADIEIYPVDGWPGELRPHRKSTTEDTHVGKTPSSIVTSPIVVPENTTSPPVLNKTSATIAGAGISAISPSSPHITAPSTTSLYVSDMTHNLTSITPAFVSSLIDSNAKHATVNLTGSNVTSATTFTGKEVMSSKFTGSQITSVNFTRSYVTLPSHFVKSTPSTSAAVSKVLFTPPTVGSPIITTPPIIDMFDVAVVTPRIPRGVTAQNANTQFVSVSNILDRFFPQYVNPFLYSNLFKPVRKPKSIRTRMHLPVGCDVTHDEFRCVARGLYQQSPGINQWCEMNCRVDNCVWFMCDCFCEDRKSSRKSTCHAIAGFSGVEGMDQWCTANCKLGYCPPNTCNVEECLQLNKET